MTVADPFNAGIVTISLDTELGWGNVYSGDYTHVERRMDSAKAAIERLLNRFDTYEVPVTWALVGQLFRDSNADGVPSGAKRVVGQKSIPWERDWWHAPDLVSAIDESPVDHEIASHSGNHLVYGDATTAAATEDLELFRSFAAEYDPVRSFVYPQNRIAHRSVLAEHGFICYRGQPPTLGTDPLPTVFRPRSEVGLVNIPASTAFRHYNGRSVALRSVPNRVKGWLLRAGVVRAHHRGAVFHVVLHPNDFTLDDGERLLTELDSFLAFVREKREAGAVRTCTMGEVADLAEF